MTALNAAIILIDSCTLWNDITGEMFNVRDGLLELGYKLAGGNC